MEKNNNELKGLGRVRAKPGENHYPDEIGIGAYLGGGEELPHDNEPEPAR